MDEPAKGAGGGIAIGQQTLLLRGIHQIHQAGVAGALHGDREGVSHLLKGVGALVVGGNSQLHGDRLGSGRLGSLDILQIRQAVVLVRTLRPNAAILIQQGQEAACLHVGQGLADCTVVVAGSCGAVVVAVFGALCLLILEAGPALVAAVEAVTLVAGDGDGARRIAVLSDVAVVHIPANKAAGVAACADIAKGEAVADGAAVS